MSESRIETARRVFEAMKEPLLEMLEESPVPGPEEAYERLTAVAAPICEAAGAPPEVAGFLACEFIRIAANAMRAALAVKDLEEHGVNVEAFGVLPGGEGIVLGVRQPEQPSGEPSLN